MSISAPIGALFCAALLQAPLPAQDPPGDPPQRDLTELSLEELMNVEVVVTSAARHETSLWKTPAAIFVLSADEIRRSGATSIPEALRGVPGVSVARLDSNRWAVSIRGFNGQFANSLLVLVDGKSVYTPLFSGTWWDTLDVPLDDIERIEVIRGPGAALWGANAVNGIINIITKPAASTQGERASVTIGTYDRFLGYLRHGGELEDGHWRAWMSYSNHGPLDDAAGGDGSDEWDLFHAGFRVDRSLTEHDDWTLWGDAYNGFVDGKVDVAVPAPQYSFVGAAPTDVWGANLQSRWTHRFGERDEASILGYLDHQSRRLLVFGEERTSAGFDYQRRQPLSDRQDFTYGAALRGSYSATEDSFQIAWRDDRRFDSVFSAFAQDEIVLEPERWKLVAGAKLEHDDYAGWNLQPDLRVLYTPSERQTWWASVSRAVRTPSQAEQDLRAVFAIVPGAPDEVYEYIGDRNVEPETLDALQLGYRVRPSEHVSFDATVYLHHYSDLIFYEPGTPFVSGTDLIVPLTATNMPSANAYGFELATEWTPAEETRLSLAWTAQKTQVDPRGSVAPDVRDPEGKTPQNQVRLSLQRDFDEHFSTQCALSWTDRLTTDSVPAYWRADVSLDYRPDAQRTFSLGLQNLFHDDGMEFGPSTFNPSNRVDTALYLRASWSF
ncbi:MAG: TonB-dependent receptor [Planctomycetes bacterium]|nr:TonB-dependent receptor [Planctomycetota bacterium]